MIQPRFMRFAFVIAGMLIVSHAHADDAADDHPRVTLGTTGGATLASAQYDLTRATDSNVWIGAATGVPLLVEGDASSGVIAAGELTIDIRISRYVSLEIAGRLGVEWMSASTNIVSGTYPLGDARLGIAWDLTRTPRIEPHTTASR